MKVCLAGGVVAFALTAAAIGLGSPGAGALAGDRTALPVTGQSPGTVPGTVPGTIPPHTGPPAQMSLGSAGPVASGTTVPVRVTGADPHAGPQPVALCGGAAGNRRCSPLGTMSISPDGQGTREIYLETPALLGRDGPVDCRVVACAVEIGDGPRRVAATPVTFRPEGGRRYADRVFADLAVTRGLVYGRAPAIVPLDPDGTAYGEGPADDLLLDLYEPRGDTLAERPVVVYIHGGYFSPGNGYDRTTQGEAVRFANDWTRRGYVVAAIDYRLLEGPTTAPARLARAVPTAQHDTQAAVRWLRANAERFRLSRSAIAVAGYSAGATTALNVGYYPHDPGDSGTPGESSEVKAVLSMSGALSTPDVIGSNIHPPYAEPLRPGSPPVLMFNATQDLIIPYDWALRTREAIRNSGNTVELITYDGQPHVFIPEKDYDVMPRSTAFLLVHLAPGGGTEGTEGTEASPAVAVKATPAYTG